MKIEGEKSKNFYCEFKDCSYKTTSKSNLNIHIRNKHTPDKDIKWFHCDKCNYKTKNKSHLKIHISSVHNINSKWFNCNICNYKCKISSNMKRHINTIHNENPIWYNCNLCDYKTKNKSHIKRHKSVNHNIDVKWFHCDECDYKTKTNSQLKLHKLRIHIEVFNFHCDKCNYKAKTNGELNRHKAYIHNENIIWYECNKCEEKFKCNVDLRRHKANIHNINVTWYECNLCNYKCKSSGNLNIHKVNVHNINVIWYKCLDENCDYKTKSKSYIKQHFKSLHSLQAQLRHKREEQRIARLLDANNIPYKREERVNFSCFDSGKRYACIDFTIFTKSHLTLLEVDENQHKFGEYTVACDMKRMSHIITALRCQSEFENVPIVFIRYNPNTYRVNEIIKKKSKKVREKELLEFINTYIPSQDTDINYMFYDCQEFKDGSVTPKVLTNQNYDDNMINLVSYSLI